MDINGLFNQVDTNRDGGIDQQEFSQFAASGFGGGCAPTVNQGSISLGAGCPPLDLGPRGGACALPNWQRDGQGNFVDPNPRVENRAATGEGPTYQQNIRIRFLQPPPLPPPPPITVREVRGPNAPAPPPHRVRGPQPPAPPQPPPLVIRERPPVPPPAQSFQDRTINLPGYPAPPRAVITERFAPLPPRPRDVIMERWLPYGPRPCPQVRRIPAPCGPPPPAPRNLIIQYGAVQARVVRQFQRLGVTPQDPQAYVQQYGANLLDSAAFVSQARAAGVVEDISPPAGAAGASASASFGGSAGYSASADYSGGAAVEGGYGASAEASFGASEGGFSSYSSSENGGGAVMAGGFEAVGSTSEGAEFNGHFA